MIITWRDDLGDFRFDETNGIDVLEGLVGFDMAPVNLTYDQRVTFDGAALSRSRFAPRVMLLPLWFEDQFSARRRVSALASRLVRPGGSLMVEDDGRVRYLFEVARSAGLEGSETALGTWRRQVLELTAGDPFWYSEIRSQILNADGSTLFDDGDIGFDDVSPFDGGDTTQVPVLGDTPTFPLVVVDGPFTSLSVVDVSSGRSLSLAAPLGVGERLLIETRPGARGPRLSGAGVDWSLLTPSSRLFELPRNAVVAVSSSGADVASRVEMRWRDRWATV